MKKSVKLIVAICISVLLTISFAACNTTVYKSVAITGAVVEEYGFAISKDAANKDTVLAAINTVIERLGSAAIINHLTYHSMLEQGDASGTPGFTVTEPTTSTANGTLCMYTNAAFPPYEYVSGDEEVGLDVDIMKLAAVELNMAFDVVDMDFDGLSAAVANLEEGKTKVIGAGLTITEERQTTLAFSDPYMSSAQYIVCAEDATYDTVASLAGLKIGVQLGTTGDFLISDAIEGDEGALKDTGATIVQYKSAALAFQALKAGKIDVLIIDKHPSESLVENQ